MLNYLIKRFLLIIPTFLGITLVVFTITRMVPGGPIEKMITEMQLAQGDGKASMTSAVAGSTLSDEQLQELKEFYGFDKPILVSYWEWLKKVVQFDLGRSTRYNDPVWDTIKSKMPVSIFYGITTMILTYLVCIPLGVAKAIRHGGIFDNLSSILVFIGYAIPGYVVGILLVWFFAFKYEIFPMGGFTGDEFEELSLAAQIWDITYHAILPLIAYMLGSFALMTFIMKNSLMDNLAADYVRTAMAKGLSFPRAVIGHAFRNSFIPLATHLGNSISVLVAGSFLIEKIFNIDGIGLLGFEALVEKDYPVVMGLLVITAMLTLIGNILSDICVAIVDPRVKFQGVKK
ncbi:MAG: ABC transporter permease subunit [Gammaproteobacteria bacterium]|nr:MAG: ABC transporter permease subunit [Gammaproteobacteria bacterium]